MYIAPEWLALERDILGKRPLISGTVAEVRAAYAETSEQLAPLYPPPSVYQVQDHKEVTDSGIAIRVYTPARPVPADERFPVFVFAHGGGHVNGGAWASSFEDRMCRYICHHAGVVVAQVDFRLAPENPVPAQLNDTYNAYNWCWENAERLRGDRGRFFAAGSSLGGGVAVGTALKLRDENLGARVRGVLALCPALLHPDGVPAAFRERFRSYAEAWTGAPMQDGESMLRFFECNGGAHQMVHPYVFPGTHPGLARLPPVYQAVCGADPVRDDANIFKDVLDQAGMDSWPGLPHYFWLFPQLESSLPFHEKVAAGVKWLVLEAFRGASREV